MNIELIEAKRHAVTVLQAAGLGILASAVMRNDWSYVRKMRDELCGHPNQSIFVAIDLVLSSAAE